MTRTRPPQPVLECTCTIRAKCPNWEVRPVHQNDVQLQRRYTLDNKLVKWSGLLTLCVIMYIALCGSLRSEFIISRMRLCRHDIQEVDSLLFQSSANCLLKVQLQEAFVMVVKRSFHQSGLVRWPVEEGHTHTQKHFNSLWNKNKNL